MSTASSHFKEKFQLSSEITSRAPGRLEILGNHTDYNSGAVMSITVDKSITIALGKSSSSECSVFSPDVEASVRKFELNDIDTPLPNKDWTNYIRGCAYALKKHGYEIGAFNATITSDIPLSAGVSSSAALEMALITGLDALFQLDIPLLEKAKLGQYCENHYIMANTGLMDQISSLSGKQNQIIISEYKNLTINYAPFPEELALVVINSHVAHDLSKEYNERREQCTEAYEALSNIDPSLEALCDSSVAQLTEHRDSMSTLAYRRALHVLEEHERVAEASRQLQENNFAAFGNLLFQSHDSSINNFENSCPELDQLVAFAKNSPLCLGARLSGGGFGGISIHLVKKQDAEAYRQQAADAFKNTSGKAPQSFICSSSEGASIISSLKHKLN